MKIWKKNSFYHHNWFWCQLHGIGPDDIHRINGSFIRMTAKCTVHDHLRGALYARVY